MDLNTVTEIDGSVKIETVLISLADKTGLEEFVSNLLTANPDILILSTGGTFSKIKDMLPAGSGNLMSVSEYTGQPEMQGGLVKSLDFKIYLGLLSETYNEDHLDDMKRTGARKIDMTVVNLYPFGKVTAEDCCSIEKARSNIDIGGPCMLRASAKNYLRVAPVCDNSDFCMITGEMISSGGCISLETRLKLAKKAFAYTAEYDAAISAYLAEKDFSAVEEFYNIK